MFDYDVYVYIDRYVVNSPSSGNPTYSPWRVYQFYFESLHQDVWFGPIFLPEKKRTNCTYCHHTPNTDTSIPRLHDVQRWNLRSFVRRFTSHRSELWNTFWHTGGRSVISTRILFRHLWGLCNSCQKKEISIVYHWTEYSIGLEIAHICKEMHHPHILYIAFSNLIFLRANSTTTNPLQLDFLLWNQPTTERARPATRPDVDSSIPYQGRSTLYVGINSSHL